MEASTSGSGDVRRSVVRSKDLPELCYAAEAPAFFILLGLRFPSKSSGIPFFVASRSAFMQF